TGRTWRCWIDPSFRHDFVGFRCLSSVNAEPNDSAVLPVAEQGTQTNRFGGAEKILRSKTIRVLGDQPKRTGSCASPCLRIQSDLEEHHVKRFGYPDWASAFGIDGYGVYADLPIPVEGSKPFNQRLRWIPPGRFRMGSPDSEPGRSKDEVQHDVIISNAFWIFETPCTQAFWSAVMGNNPSRFKDPDRPVEYVSWHDAVEFAQALTEKINDQSLQFTLPTEAQWEYACRAGTTTPIYSGDLEILGNADALDAIAWYAGNSKNVDEESENAGILSRLFKKRTQPTEAGTQKVGQKRPNPWGLRDMLGNVQEWCGGWRGDHGTDLQTDPAGPLEGSYRVIRGGSWIDGARDARSASRSVHRPSDRGVDVGFRCLSSVKPSAEQVSTNASEPRDEAAAS
ncbi:MAG: formylglycine-generating enzyme family protein, partial [Planctomycetota bacterium]